METSFQLNDELSKYHEVLPLDIRFIKSNSFWKELKEFKPDIIHYIHGASLKSFILLKMISFYSRKSKTIISMLHPYFSSWSHFFIRFFGPDLILVQSDEVENMFKNCKCEIKFFPLGGVDTTKFNPEILKKKEELRIKYNIETDKFIILHVGSIKKGRNISFFEKVQNVSSQVLIIAPVSTGLDNDQLLKLKKSGCIVWREYFDNIEEIYAISDCYFFPVLKSKNGGKYHADSIELPLSVLEAMSCNLPVISTKFGSLPRLFEEGNGLFFLDDMQEYDKLLSLIKENKIIIQTRQKVLYCSWENLGKRLSQLYYQIKV
jgi:glycosyltransferase involved in cell wall biosynthesis